VTNKATLAILLCARLAQAKQPEVISTKWDQLEAAVAGRKLTVGLKSGKTIKGSLAGLDGNGMTLDQGRKRGSATISRRDISDIKAARKKQGTKGRAIGTAVGAGAAVAVVSPVFVYLNNEGGVGSGNGAIIAAVALAAGAGITLLGYGIGAAMDGGPVRVQISDLVP
jgi:hypothetical protein